MKTNALKLRQHFGQILEELRAGGEPIIIEKGRRPVAVLVSYEDFQRRFVDKQDQERRENLVQLFRNAAAAPSLPSLTALRELRTGHA